MASLKQTSSHVEMVDISYDHICLKYNQHPDTKACSISDAFCTAHVMATYTHLVTNVSIGFLDVTEPSATVLRLALNLGEAIGHWSACVV